MSKSDTPRPIIQLETDTRINIPNKVELYLHCAQCLRELPPGQSPATWSRTQTGYTAEGFQVWCNRHDCNVAIIRPVLKEVS